ncbi:stage III sporulation protein AF [Pseudogracilibacillus sp. SO30301A]|uniref:stage III sporulation protein AF n=1 Tax=Pseudogracilibacillus sp. SO30301A TaxID=3098291 RepID=UPI00300E3E92
MNVISEWVMQVIVFILLGTIVELLIPNNSMKKYVNIVIGLLLLLVLAKPILYLFTDDVTAQLDKFEQIIFQEEATLSETETLMEIQKRDIQAEQDAYIWNEVKLQLMKEANPILFEQYSAQIVDLTFSFDEPYVDSYENLDEVIITLRENTDGREPDDKEADVINPIIIETDRPKEPRRKNNNDTNISDTLEEIWGLDKGTIKIMWEGGAS